MKRTMIDPFLLIMARLKRAEWVGILSIFNLILILCMGAIMLALCEQSLFFFLTLVLMGSASLIIFVLLYTLECARFSAQKDYLKSKAYDCIPSPLLILTPELHFCYGNKKALDVCWWAQSIPYLRKILAQPEQKQNLDRLIEKFHQKKEWRETLCLNGIHGQEVWHIHSFPLGEKALWQCVSAAEESVIGGEPHWEFKAMTLFLNNAEEGLFSLNEKGVILYCNEKFAQWLGYSCSDLIGESFSKVLVKSRSEAGKLYNIQGKCDFLTFSSRTKSGYIKQKIVDMGKGEILTHSLLYVDNFFASHEDMTKVLDMTPLPILCLDEQGVVQDSNILFQEKFSFGEPVSRGVSFFDLVLDSQRDEIKTAFKSFVERSGEASALDIYLNDKSESVVSAHLGPLPLKDQKGCLLLFQDITDQKRFERQLIQSQKMQAVGQLAGGIAHDFNNLLTAMIGFCDLLLNRCTPGDQSFTDVMQIRQNGSRAANLVRQLLAFSRKQTLQPKVLDITDCLSELSALLCRLIGSNIDLKMKHTRDLGLVLVDQGQFEQVIINVVVNARDAMKDGGSVTLTTENCELKKPKRFGHDIVPVGSYVLVEITDTGIGIKAEDIDRIFDPFFSTKEMGEGTGLGLSTVYGIVKQTGGFIHVKSKEGEGTTFSIYLPHCTPEQIAETPVVPETKETALDLTGSSTILLVEDEAAVRLFSARALRSKGYEVLEAMNGEEALELVKKSTQKIDLIISDVVMPQMDGPTFVNEMGKFTTTPKVLFISGYTEDTFHNRIKNNANIRFLAKPFSLNDLATRVKEVLTEKPGPKENPQLSMAN